VNSENAAFGHRLNGVDDQVGQGLLDEPNVDLCEGLWFGVVGLEDDVRLLRHRVQQGERTIRDATQALFPALGWRRRANPSSCLMMLVMRSAWSTMACALSTSSAPVTWPRVIILARPKTTLRGVPSSCATPKPACQPWLDDRRGEAAPRLQSAGWFPPPPAPGLPPAARTSG